MAYNLTERYQEKFGIKTRLRGYQRQAANQAIAQDGVIALLMDPRLGKTRVDIAVSGYLFKNEGLDKWLIICPVIAMDVWKQEIINSLDVPYELELILGRMRERRAIVKGWQATPGKLSILIMNFEALGRIRKVLYKFRAKKTSIDESQRIKNRTTTQSKVAHTLGLKSEFRTILTGTFMSKPYDCFSQYKFLDPSILGTKWKRSHKSKDQSQGFLDVYADKWGFGGHMPTSWKNLDELHRLIHTRAFYLTRAQAGGFPEEHTQDFSFTLTNPALRHYREMEDELRTMVEGHRVSAAIVLTQILRLQQITGGFLPVLRPDEDQATNVPLGNDRIMALADLLDQYPVDEPLVILAKFRYEISAILELVKKMGRTTNSIVGGMKNRPQAIADFQSGLVSTSVVQIRAGGISVDLSRADTAIFYSTSDHMAYEQARARIIARTGGRVFFLRLKAEGTIDEGILESLDRNQDTVTNIMEKLHLL